MAETLTMCLMGDGERDISGLSLPQRMKGATALMRCTSSTDLGDNARRPSVGCSIDWYNDSS